MTPKLGFDYGPTILFLGAHCDDIEIGCGGTAAKLVAAGRKIAFAIAANCGTEREDEARQAVRILGLNPADDLYFCGAPDMHLEEHQQHLQEWLRDLLERIQPTTVFVHHGDNNPDHAAVFKVAIRCCNRQHILQYFVPQMDTRRTAFMPNVTEDISEFVEKKLSLCACHVTQADKPVYLDPQFLKATAFSFYVEAHSVPGTKPNGFAEAFFIHKYYASSEGSSESDLGNSFSIPSPLGIEQSAVHHSYSWADLANAADRVGKYVFGQFHADAVITFSGHSAIFANLVLVSSLCRSELLALPVYLGMNRDIDQSSLARELPGYKLVPGSGFATYIPEALVRDDNRPRKIAIIDDAITTGEQIFTVKKFLLDELNYKLNEIAVACFVCHEMTMLIPDRRPDAWEFITPTTAYHLPWGAPLWFPRPGQ